MAAFTVSAMSPRHMVFVVLASVVSDRAYFSLANGPNSSIDMHTLFFVRRPEA